VPALPPYIIKPIWHQFEALLPERRIDHPLGCHRPRIPDGVAFEKLVQILVFGCAYERIAEEKCSKSTLPRRREEWIGLGVMEHLRRICLERPTTASSGWSSRRSRWTAARPRPLAGERRSEEGR
jgi:transposase